MNKKGKQKRELFWAIFPKGKKGALFHWIVFGMLAALAFFLIFSNLINLSTEPIGKLSLDFVNDPFYASEINNLELEAEAIKLSNDIYLQMALVGGFDKELGPAYEQTFYGWNRENEALFPDVEANFISLFKKKTSKTFNINIQEVKVLNNELIVKIEPIENKTSKTTYTYNPSFRIKVSPLDEYKTLFNEAIKIIDSCNKKKDLYSCLNNIKPKHWKVGSCKKEVFLPIQDREVSFCVESPQNTKLKNSKGEDKPLQYRLLLDFKGGPLEIEYLDAVQYKKQKNYVVSFRSDPKIKNYVLYYTNQEIPLDKLPEYSKNLEIGDSLFMESKNLKSIKECPPLNHETEVAYTCNGIISYVLLEERPDLFFGVAQVINGKEEKINQFVKSVHLLS